MVRGSGLDFELEAAVVVGRGGRDVSVDEAEPHIAGYVLMNDWSARDPQFAEMHVRLGPAKGKDSAGNAFDLRMTAAVDGRVVGEDRWSNMAFSYAQMIAHVSRGTEVRNGDILGSGTCGGGCLAELWGREGLDAHPPLAPRRHRHPHRRTPRHPEHPRDRAVRARRRRPAGRLPPRPPSTPDRTPMTTPHPTAPGSVQRGSGLRDSLTPQLAMDPAGAASLARDGVNSAYPR
ncbi:fumarylacetoacetate hydrolase family protein [Streptomyces sp. NPDC005811]|uniref:fumarylacetoacetate hydrolase family protein n=1 Tax=Streptomyces sp. NPDC005811 TaxID=3154565 RepID=UPI0033D97CE4